MNFIGIFIFFLFAVFLIYFLNQQTRKENLIIVEAIKDTIVFSLTNVVCSTFKSGIKGGNFDFNRCDLYLNEDALIILGYKKIGVFEYLSSPVIVVGNYEEYPLSFKSAKVMKPKKINMNSFNNEVYIEFEVKGWMTTTLEIRLKHISFDNKEKLKTIVNLVDN